MQESELKSAQQAQQDAELAAAKQEFATRLAGHQELAQVRPALYLSFALQGSGSLSASHQQKHAFDAW